MKEEFRPIIGYEELYEISNLGRILSCARVVTRMHRGRDLHYEIKAKKLKLNRKPDKSGYIKVSLSKNNNVKMHYIHRLMALAFIQNTENKPEVNHKDGNKHNNILSNLEWSTHPENVKHAYDLGLKKTKGLRGEANSRAKLTTSQVLEIRSLSGERQYSRHQLADKYNVAYDTITSILLRRNWKHI